MSQEEEQEFNKAVINIDYDKDNRSEDKALKQACTGADYIFHLAAGEDKLRDVVKKYRDSKQSRDKDNDAVLDSIADMLYSPEFQELLQHSSPAEIDQKVQAFL